MADSRARLDISYLVFPSPPGLRGTVMGHEPGAQKLQRRTHSSVRLLRAPLLHFMGGGLLLFALRSALLSPPSARHDHPCSPPPALHKQGELAPALRETRLALAALQAGWDQGDPVISRRLIQVTDFLEQQASTPEQKQDAAYRLGLHCSDPVVRERLLELVYLSLDAQLHAAEQPRASREEPLAISAPKGLLERATAHEQRVRAAWQALLDSPQPELPPAPIQAGQRQ